MSGPLNTAYFDNLTEQIARCSSCAELQELTTTAITALNAQLAAITAANAEFAALQSLLVSPAADLTAIVTWITSLISLYLGPQLAAYAKLTAQVAAMTTEIATLSSAITSAASNFENCSISIP
jgi:hypothetical protein